MPPATKKRVLITGFGPFRNIEVNPSWQAVSRLAKSHPSALKFDLTALEIEVTYEDVNNRIPSLAQSHDIVIHVGVGDAGAVRLERQAAGDGYYMPDANGKRLGRELQKNEVFETGVDLDSLFKVLKKRWENVRISEDAGRYLCEYIFYTSLSSARPGTPVIFVHVTPDSKPYSVDQLAEILGDILTWMTTKY